jgi:hypothetical protein
VTEPKLEFLVTQDTDRPHLVSLPNHELEIGKAFLDFLIEREDEWTFLELKEQDADSAMRAVSLQLDNPKYWVRHFPNPSNNTIDIEWDSLRQYYASLSANMRSAVSRHIRSLIGAGDLHVVTSSNSRILPLLFDAYLNIERRSWKVLAGAGVGRHPLRIQHHLKLMELDQPMETQLTLVILDGLPIAGILNAGYCQTLYQLELVHDHAFGHLGPGSLTYLLSLRSAIEGGFRRYNVLANFEYHKSRWLAHAIPTVGVQLYRMGSAHFYKALFGDFYRKIAPPPMDGRGPNLTRGDVPEDSLFDDSDAIASRRSARMSSSELEWLLRAVVESGGTHLTGTELSDLLPFKPGKPIGQKFASRGRSTHA